MSNRPLRFPVRPAIPIEFLLWDGTEARDSDALGNGFLAMRLRNLLHDCTPSEQYLTRGSRGHPRTFMPAGVRGTDVSDALWVKGLFEFPRMFFDPHHNNNGHTRPDILAFSGHGVPGFMFSESGILMCSSRPMTGTYNSWHYITNPVWNNPATKIVILSACRQLSGTPNQYYWAKTMRSSNPVHMILGYMDTAPNPNTSARINKKFLRNLRNSQPFVQAWRNAHNGTTYQTHWAILCYTSSLSDRLDEWFRAGRIKSAPSQSGEIKYFDNNNIAGRVVNPVPPAQYFHCYMTPRNSWQKIPPWSWLRPNVQLDLHIETTSSSSLTFEVGDTIWIGCIQVRPDYAGVGEPAPDYDFDISRVFTLISNPNLEPGGSMIASGRLHDRTAGWTASHNDVYMIKINQNLRWATLNSARTHLTIPIKLGSRFNQHYQIFYYMIMLHKNSSGLNYGIHIAKVGSEEIGDQVNMVNDYQYGVFCLGV